ncbi:MAG TPA: hypothetical protein VL092_10030 [Chitinophagaceae bacterium]|nr:hypothetical protein [Chitinophagaceae bacterium]
MQTEMNSVLLFKTNIQSLADQFRLRVFLDKIKSIQRWTIDTEDIDCVLRIVSTNLHPAQVMQEIRLMGYECSELD